MPAVELSEETYCRVEAFRTVINAVMAEQLDTEACLTLILERGLHSMLRDILGPQDQATLLESIQQLAAREPSAVYRYVAETLNAGAKIHELQSHRPRIGFSGLESEGKDRP